MSDDYDNDYVSRSPRWDLNPRPKVFALHSLSFSSSPPSILSERRITKPSPRKKMAQVGSVILLSQLRCRLRLRLTVSNLATGLLYKIREVGL